MNSNDFRIYENVSNKKKLDITLLAVATNNIPQTLASLRRCINLMDFSKIKLFTDVLPVGLPSDIEFVQCPPLNYNTYMNYTFRDLGEFVDTSHCLLVQYDSWILRPQMWKDEWLQYDYIAPPWSTHECMKLPSGEYIRVGCGGFSLRSKKLLDLPKQLNLPLVEYVGHPYNMWADDWNFCVYYRDIFLEQGITYAPRLEATQFGQEMDMDENKGIYPFGFHKYVH